MIILVMSINHMVTYVPQSFRDIWLHCYKLLIVGSRMINRFFLKKFEFNAVILLQFGDWGDMPKVFLRNVVIIEVQILLQGGFQMPGGGESGGSISRRRDR